MNLFSDLGDASMRDIRDTTLLIVDDEPINLAVLIEYLESYDLTILVARDGESALEKVHYGQPSLILLDILLPEGMNGFEVCRRLKINEASKDIPVIFMTALNDLNSKVRGFEVGAVDYITKPFEFQEVMARVTTHLTLQALQKKLEQKNEAYRFKNQQLREALAQVKTLHGLLPICADCKKIRDDSGYWQDVAVYIRDHSAVEFTHGLCPDCAIRLYPQFYEK
jgi:CheY-like chemotaxis protein